jgi:prevent-host-death family protein
MDTVSARELCDNAKQVLARVERGETLTVTSDGRPVAKLTPLPRATLTSRELVEQAKALPAMSYEKLMADIDAIMDTSL